MGISVCGRYLREEPSRLALAGPLLGLDSEASSRRLHLMLSCPLLSSHSQTPRCPRVKSASYQSPGEGGHDPDMDRTPRRCPAPEPALSRLSDPSVPATGQDRLRLALESVYFLLC